jgi:hypothetical protein
MGLLDKKPSEIINSRKWCKFLEIRKSLIIAYREQNTIHFLEKVEEIRKIARGDFQITLKNLLKIPESEYKHLRILQELTLDKKELIAIMKE